MLVLSRGRNDKVVFPHLGITVEILAIQGNKVGLGVDAPPEVVVLRHELLDAVRARPSEEPPVKLFHELRNRLNAATLALHLSQKQLHAGMQRSRVDAGEGADRRRLPQAPHLQRQPPVRPSSPPLRRALLVEDNANESELLAGYLRLSGFEVETACDGCDALGSWPPANRRMRCCWTCGCPVATAPRRSPPSAATRSGTG